MEVENTLSTEVSAPPRRWLRPEQAADYLGLAKSTLAKMRVTGDGPSFNSLTKRSITYDVKVLDAWLEGRQRQSTSEEVAP